MQLPLSPPPQFDCHLTANKPEQNGKACRFIDSGGLDNLAAGELHLVGLNHRSASLSIRSRLGFTPERRERFLTELKELGALECTIICTCNRTEVYALGVDSEQIVQLLSHHGNLPADELREHLYIKKGVCSACHLFRVAAGLDSAVLGETEIVAQVKQGWRVASELDLTGPTIDLLFQRALEASKRIRSETELCRSVTSVGSLSVREAEALAGDLSEKRILILGAGQISHRVCKELSATAVEQVLILNRTLERGMELAEKFGFAFESLDYLETALENADVVFAAATSQNPLITRQDLEPLMARRENRPLVLIDLGVPPNIETGGDIDGVRSVDMDTLISLCSANSERRISAVPAALGILDEELDRVKSTLAEREAASTIRALIGHGNDVKERSLTWALDRLPDLTQKESRVVNDLARRIVLGMLTPLIEELKSGASEADRETIERLFRLAGDDES